MTTSTAVSPFVVGDIERVEFADEQGKRTLWKKQILPAGKRKYEGEELDFAQINPAVISAFDDGAFDTVPFVMSLPKNKHPELDEEADQLEGVAEKLELAQDGSLFGFFDLSNSPKVQELIKKSKGKFGVSGRIERDYTAKDTGKQFPFALSHVCGTLRPYLKGMSPWESVDLGEVDEDKEVIDFSGEVIDEPNDKGAEDDLVRVEIPPEKLAKLMALLDADDGVEEEEKEDNTENKEVVLPAAAQAQIAAAEEGAKAALQLAENMQIDAASTRWDAERAKFLSEGIPPAILDMAGKVLKRHKPVTLTFSEDDVVDATDVVRQILSEVKGYIVLGDERGHGFREDDIQENSQYQSLEKAFDEFWTKDGRG